MKGPEDESAAGKGSGAEMKNMRRDLAWARLESRDNFRAAERSKGTFRATEEQSGLETSS